MTNITSRWTVTLLLCLASGLVLFFIQDTRGASVNANTAAAPPQEVASAKGRSGHKVESTGSVLVPNRSELAQPEPSLSTNPSLTIVEEPAPSIGSRRVWLEQTEMIAARLLDGNQSVAEAAEMLSDLIESANSEELQWETVDGVESCVIVQAEDLGQATIRFNPQPSGVPGAFEIELSFVDPPGVWSSGEAHSSTLTFDLQLDGGGSPKFCSAFLNSSLRQKSQGGPEENREPMRSGAILRVSKDGVSKQSMTTHVESNGNRSYKLHDPEPQEGEGLESQEMSRLAQVLRGLRRGD